MGVARTLVYKGKVNDPLYTLNADGSVNITEVLRPYMGVKTKIEKKN